MNTQTQEALKMAIEGLEFFQKNSEFWKDTVEEAIQSCKEALAQPAQEPVAWMDEEGIWQYEWESHSDNKKPLYTHPAPSWQGLSDDEINDIVNKIRDDMYPWKDGMLVGKVARAIEQALKDKNT